MFKAVFVTMLSPFDNFKTSFPFSVVAGTRRVIRSEVCDLKLALSTNAFKPVNFTEVTWSSLVPIKRSVSPTLAPVGPKLYKVVLLSFALSLSSLLHDRKVVTINIKDNKLNNRVYGKRIIFFNYYVRRCLSLFGYNSKIVKCDISIKVITSKN